MDISRLGSDLRGARVAAGLSLLRVAEVTGISGPQISRIERGLSPSTSIVQLVRLGAVVGLDVRIRAYPGGDPIRDAGHVQLIERFRKRLAPTVGVRLEVPLPIEGDRRAWDLFLDRLVDEEGRLRGMPAEVETRIHDAQAQVRRITLKMRDASTQAVLVVVADTPLNRRAVAAAAPMLTGAFPVTARKALAALAEGRYPGGSCLLFI
ncbi:MAG TPA: helix-turn-helix transcriptional regulator [Candidatus Limnocylindrales bacterium]|nr:helix-turn-helix transcriptional regulator [Candidatus Limnocylindrales bacterium]